MHLINKGCPMPQRYLLTLMGFFGLVVAYSMRLSLSVAITQMVPPPLFNSENISTTVCLSKDINYQREHEPKAVFESLYNNPVSVKTI